MRAINFLINQQNILQCFLCRNLTAKMRALLTLILTIVYIHSTQQSPFNLFETRRQIIEGGSGNSFNQNRGSSYVISGNSLFAANNANLPSILYGSNTQRRRKPVKGKNFICEF